MTLPPLNLDLVRRIVRAALEEDGAFQDVTTSGLVPPEQTGRGTFLAKASGVVCGLPVAAVAFEALDPGVGFESRIEDGTWVEAGSRFAAVEGSLSAILSAERVALNLMQRLSGTATLTRELVEAVKGLPVRIIDTRKTTPGLRNLERYAVQAGGGANHRFNLSDGILIKDNHIAAARGRGLSIAEVIAASRKAAPHTLKVEIEVTDLEETRAAVAGGADVILLDNMSVEMMAEAVRLVKGRALTEASGGITLKNVRAVAETGVDLISSGALTHSAPSLDISLNVEAGGSA
jgi:nicotinate-nucleotide pyrophosphorylase (carboxylating)